MALLQDFSKSSYICLNGLKYVHIIWLFEALILFFGIEVPSFYRDVA
jgi:hypothetical protein